MIQFAFKEWAIICQALAAGRQAVILRKGGIAEEGDTFRPDQARFWLYPTYLHQKPDAVHGIDPAWWATIEQQRPPQGKLRLTHYAEVPVAYRCVERERLEALATLHCWSSETVTQRFHYRTPGLFVLPVRVYALAEPLLVPDLLEYEGCKTWVDLGQGYPASGSPVLTPHEFASVVNTIEQAIGR